MATPQMMTEWQAKGERTARSKRSPAGMQRADRMLMAAAPRQPDRAERSEKSRAAPTFEDIRCRAYEIYCGRNGGPGDALSDWLAAERELCDATQTAAAECERRRAMALLALNDGDPVC